MPSNLPCKLAVVPVAHPERDPEEHKGGNLVGLTTKKSRARLLSKREGDGRAYL